MDEGRSSRAEERARWIGLELGLVYSRSNLSISSQQLVRSSEVEVDLRGEMVERSLVEVLNELGCRRGEGSRLRETNEEKRQRLRGVSSGVSEKSEVLERDGVGESWD